VDDGSKTVEQSLGVLRRMAEAGVTDVCLTPHLLASRAHLGVPPIHDAAFAALTRQADGAVRLHRGAEVMLDKPMAPQVATERRITLAGSSYILVEFTRLVTGHTVLQALTMLTEIGLKPIVAHPERYSSCTPRMVARWRETGARMQVDATTLLSPRGRGDRARQLVAHGLADIAAADNHGDDRTLRAGHELLKEHGGATQAELLMTTNPAAILSDGAMQPVPALTWRRSILQRLRRLFETEEW
jgi:protein-tyrosine phosphatase